jgi:hypothetical protein
MSFVVHRDSWAARTTMRLPRSWKVILVLPARIGLDVTSYYEIRLDRHA